MQWVRRIAQELGAMGGAFARIPEYTETAERLYLLLRNRTAISRDGSIVSPLLGAHRQTPDETGFEVFPIPSLSRSR
ncbi:MAG: hypothetical protein QN198_00580 [Armatimonadota bacterium]|nr:hypothetical protein [Armatimonadota bacterium]MDR5702077.1 hypothetical protein [Armatimonadota bacterium]MDR7434602.1 hypothetical protein [Armatimonadota bacterium]